MNNEQFGRLSTACFCSSTGCCVCSLITSHSKSRVGPKRQDVTCNSSLITFFLIPPPPTTTPLFFIPWQVLGSKAASNVFVLIRLGPQKGIRSADWALLDGSAVKRSPLKYPLCASGFYGLDVNSISWLLAESLATLISSREGTNSSSAEKKKGGELCFTF